MSLDSKEKKLFFDAIIIGTGPGGEGAAMGLAKAGYKVAVIEKEDTVGGGCTHWGTIPSKALRHAVSRIIEFNNSSLFTENNNILTSNFTKILEHAYSVINKQTLMRQDFYTRNNCSLIFGTASFTGKNCISVISNSGNKQIYSAKNIIIATGSRPYHPEDINFSSSRIYDSDSILNLKHSPKHIVIYGAGVIGCEYASIFRGLGIKVDLINTRNKLLEFLDNEICDSLSYHLSTNGVLIRNDETYESIKQDKNKVITTLKSGKVIHSDAVLFANGRTGNTDLLNLQELGIEINSRGQLDVDAEYRTSIKHIYAVGDVIGYPSLASAAYDQGRFVALNIIKSNLQKSNLKNIPTGIYTIPEISSLGKTEQELTKEKVPYEIGKANFKNLARAQISGTDIGMLKILFHRETKEILGIHCFGNRASEIIHIGQAIMEQPRELNTIEYFTYTSFNYPTMAEAYRVAALNGLNRIKKS